MKRKISILLCLVVACLSISLIHRSYYTPLLLGDISSYVSGDVDGNGRVNSLDYLSIKTHKKITLKDLRKENGLPTAKVIYNYFGTMQQFQEEIGSEISKRNEYIHRKSFDKLRNLQKKIYDQCLKLK